MINSMPKSKTSSSSSRPAYPRLSAGHLWLITASQNLGHPSRQSGICFGVSHMAKNAILAMDVATLDRRFCLIHDSPNLNEEISLARKKWLGILAKKRQELLIIRQVREEKGAEGRPKSHSLNDSWLMLSPRERDLIHIPIFYESLEIQANPAHYKEVLGYSSQKESPWVTPVCLDWEGGIAKPINISVMLSLNRLARFFQSIHEVLETVPHRQFPISFVLSNEFHAMTVGYDPIGRAWIFIHVNELPSLTISTSLDLAKKIYGGFRRHEASDITLIAQLYVTKRNEMDLAGIFDSWRKKEIWRDMYASPLDLISQSNWFIFAVRLGELELVQFLLRRGILPDLREEGRQRRTALIVAAMHGHYPIVKLLLSYNVSINSTSIYNEHALMAACAAGQFNIAKLLLLNGALPNLQNTKGITSLHLAADKGFFSIVTLLLNHGALPNIQTNSGSTALYWAAKKGFCRIAELLLAHGASPNISSRFNPLQIALGKRNPMMLKLLLAYGAAFNARSDFPLKTKALFDYAKEWQRAIEVEDLFTQGHSSCFFRRAPVLSEINEPGLLFCAVLKNYPEGVQLLIEAGADVNARTNGISPLDLALAFDFQEIVLILRAAKSSSCPMPRYFSLPGSELEGPAMVYIHH